VTSQIAIPLAAALLAAFWFAVASRTRKTNPGTYRLAMRGGVLAVAIGIALVVINALEAPITAGIAIPLFVATIFEFGLLIALASRTLSGRIEQRPFMIGTLTIVGAILVGVVLMFQPVTPAVFKLGFDFVLLALLAFNVWSHIAPRLRQQK